MTQRTVRQLKDLEIDEISLVDRPANQHGLVAIAKREGPRMGLIDADGNSVTEDQLEIGESVYDTDTDQVLVYVDADTAAQLDEDDGEDEYADDQYDEYEDEGDEEYEDAPGEFVGVGKSAAGDFARWNLRPRGAAAASRLRGAATNAREAARSGSIARSQARGRAQSAGETIRRGGRRAAMQGSMTARGAVGRAPLATVAGAGGAGAAGGYAGGRRRVKKSSSSTIYQELSKALGQGERDQVIAKAMDLVDRANDRADRAVEIAKSLQEQSELREYEAVAADYGLPVHPGQLGAVLKRASAALPQGDIDLLDRIFSAAGSGLFDEQGVNGYAEDSVMGRVQSIVSEAVGKSDLTPEQATTALFAANPGLYDEYLATEQT